MAKTKTRSIRATEEEFAVWDQACGDMKFNSWVKSALNVAAGEELSAPRFVEAKTPKPKGLSKSGCKHVGFERNTFCYRCGDRR